MKTRNYIDRYNYFLTGAYFAITLSLAELVILLNINGSIFFLMLGILAIITIYFLMYFCYSRSYTFYKRYFVIQRGFIKKKIEYKDIKKSFITYNHKLSYATSKKRICVVYGDRKKRIYISPDRMSDALFSIINSIGGENA